MSISVNFLETSEGGSLSSHVELLEFGPVWRALLSLLHENVELRVVCNIAEALRFH